MTTNPLGAALDLVRVERAAEKAEQTAGSRDTFQTVYRHVDAGFYNLAQSRPADALVPSSPVDVIPVARLRHLPHLALFGGIVTGQRVEAPEREFGKNPEGDDIRVNEAWIEGGGGALAGALSGLGGAVSDSYLAPVVKEIGEQSSQTARPFVNTVRDPINQRARAQELAEIREAKSQAVKRGKVPAASQAPNQIIVTDTTRNAASSFESPVGASSPNNSASPTAVTVNPVASLPLTSMPRETAGLPLLDSATSGVSANQKREKALKVAEAMKRSDAENRARADARRAKRLGVPVSVVTDAREEGESVAAAVAAVPAITAPAVLLPAAGAIPVLGATMSPTIGVPDLSSLGALAPSSIADRAQSFYEANQAAVLGSAAALTGVGLVATAATVAARRSSSGSSPRRASSKKTAKKSAKKSAGKSTRKNVREDRRGVTRNTYRGQKVYTHKGRHYVIRKRKEGNMPAGTWKFINS